MHQTSLPTIDEPIAAETEEEVRLSIVKADEKVVPAPTFTVTEHKDWKETRTCWEIGHLN
jgi:hypothetical protein